MKRLTTALLIHFLSPTLWAEALEIPGERLAEAAFAFFPSGALDPASADSVKLYRLGCSSCLLALEAIARGDSQPPAKLALIAYQPKERSATHALAAALTAIEDPAVRLAFFQEAVGLFAASPDAFLKSPEDWRAVIESRWPADALPPSNPRPWTEALNRMDEQNRLAAAIGRIRTPDAVSIEARYPMASTRASADIAKSLLFTHALPWLVYGLAESDDSSGQLPLALIDPAETLLLFQWRELEDKIRFRSYWFWRADPGDTRRESLVRWLAPYFDLPDDRSRHAAFAAFVSQAADASRSEPLSVYDAIGRFGSAGESASPAASEAARRWLADADRYLRLKYAEARSGP